MKTKWIYITTFIFTLLLCLSMAYSQTARSKNADRMYDEYLYNEAIIKYERIGKKDAHVLRRLGESYRLTGEAEKSEKQYARLFNEYPGALVAEDHLHYSDVLKMNGKYDMATDHLRKYEELHGSTMRTSGQLKDPNYYNDLKSDKGQFSIRSLKNNSDESEFGAVYYQDQVVFASSKHSPTPVYYEYDWNDRRFYDLYIAKENPKNNRKLKAIKCLHAKGGLNGRFHEGPATFTADGNTMIFTRNSYAKKKDLNAAKVRQLELWYCVKDEKGKWGKMQPLPFNNKEYSVGHPAISPDGMLLYFVSDMPGGMGETDIWYSMKDANGNWSSPLNAGSNINTEGKEMFPFYHEDGMLFFASNGLPGVGGLDVFVARAKNGKIGKPKNVGYPVNGSADDFSFVLNSEKKKGYFASNRDGQGSDDLYAYDLLKPFVLTKQIEGYAKDSKTNKLLDKVLVKLSDEKGEQVQEIITDSTGFYSFEIEPTGTYTLIGTKEKYSQTTKIIPADVDEDVIHADLLMDKIPSINLVASVTDIKTKLPIDAVLVTIKDNETGNVISSQVTNDAGSIREPLSPMMMNKKINYSLTFEKAGYVAKTINLVHTIDKEGDIAIATSLGKIELGMDIGKLIDLNPIYFDYNKSNIRPDAALELDRIVAVMKAYPDIEIELGSHSDCRGGAKYNMTLSDKRAKSSANYIISKGIPKERIYGKGYGESKLVNDCECEGKLKSNCTEEEHALNRRTEFIVVKINAPVNTQK